MEVRMSKVRPDRWQYKRAELDLRHQDDDHAAIKLYHGWTGASIFQCQGSCFIWDNRHTLVEFHELPAHSAHWQSRECWRRFWIWPRKRPIRSEREKSPTAMWTKRFGQSGGWGNSSSTPSYPKAESWPTLNHLRLRDEDYGNKTEEKNPSIQSPVASFFWVIITTDILVRWPGSRLWLPLISIVPRERELFTSKKNNLKQNNPNPTMASRW